MSTTETAPISTAVSPPCSPARNAMLTAIKRQDELTAIASRLTRAGLVHGDEADALWRAAEAAWDDAIHIASPANPLATLCGNTGRTMVALADEAPDEGQGCWSCLTLADGLREKAGNPGYGGQHTQTTPKLGAGLGADDGGQQ